MAPSKFDALQGRYDRMTPPEYEHDWDDGIDLDAARISLRKAVAYLECLEDDQPALVKALEELDRLDEQISAAMRDRRGW